jgi:hypothetical protein
MAVVHLLILGVLGELIVSTSDLTHTQLPEIAKKPIIMSPEEQSGQHVGAREVHMPHTAKAQRKS